VWQRSTFPVRAIESIGRVDLTAAEVELATIVHTARIEALTSYGAWQLTGAL